MMMTADAFFLTTTQQHACRSPPSSFYKLTVRKRQSRNTNQEDNDSSSSKITEDDAWNALERLEALDERLGVGVGAAKERAKWNGIIREWEEQSASENSNEDSNLNVYDKDGADEGKGDGGNGDWGEVVFWDDSKYVRKHGPQEAVAVFGGYPTRRKQKVEKKLAPFGLLDQFGTPKDVGPSDTTALLRKIAAGRYHVVYVWTRFNCHPSRGAIKEACLLSNTRFEEVESLNYIR